MSKSVITTAIVASMVLAIPAFAADEKTEAKSKTTIERESDGTYKEKRTRSQENTDAAGNYTSTDSNTKIKVDADGAGEKTTKTTSIDDPKGLGNKTKTVTTDTVTQDASGNVETHHKKKVDGKTVENTVQGANPAR